MAIGRTNCDASGATIKKLWENANPTSAFVAQTITLSLSGYDMIKILSDYDTSVTGIMSVVEFENTINNKGIAGVFQSADGIYLARRIITRVSAGLKFDNAYASNGSDTNSNNWMCIPVAIYGVKGVTE